MRQQLGIVLFAALLVTAGAREDVKVGPSYAGLFDALDMNDDGFLDGKEMDDAGDFLRTLDTNGDGDVTQRDVFHAVGHFRVPGPRPSAILFQALDPNGDRTIDRAELLQVPPCCGKLDRDQDGKVALREFAPSARNSRRGNEHSPSRE